MIQVQNIILLQEWLTVGRDYLGEYLKKMQKGTLGRDSEKKDHYWVCNMYFFLMKRASTGKKISEKCKWRVKHGTHITETYVHSDLNWKATGHTKEFLNKRKV